LASLGISIGFALFGGFIGGVICSRSWFHPLKADELFDDRVNFHECEPPEDDDDLHFKEVHCSEHRPRSS